MGETILGRFARRCREQPDAPALVQILGPGATARISYGELETESARAARSLAKLGVSAGE